MAFVPGPPRPPSPIPSGGVISTSAQPADADAPADFSAQTVPTGTIPNENTMMAEARNQTRISRSRNVISCSKKMSWVQYKSADVPAGLTFHPIPCLTFRTEVFSGESDMRAILGVLGLASVLFGAGCAVEAPYPSPGGVSVGVY